MKQHKALATILTLAFLTLLSPHAWSNPVFRTLYVFTGGTTGSQPISGVVMDKFGNLYGTTLSGGNETCDRPLSPIGGVGCGVVFQLVPIAHERDCGPGAGDDADAPPCRFTDMGGDRAKTPVAWQENVIYAFHGEDGANPVAPPIIDEHGDLFGTTEYGGPGDCGSYGCGVVYQLSRRGNQKWTEQVIAQFNDGNGVIPAAPLTFDHEGNLYGTTSGGDFGLFDTGTVFKLSPKHHGGWINTELYHFNSYDGLTPMSGVIFDPEGNLYGTTMYGGNGGRLGNGNVYRLSPNADGTWTETVLRAFELWEDMGHPQGELLRYRDGNLIGDAGEVFELKRNSDDSWTFSQIGGGFSQSFVMDKAGALYGMDRGDFGNIFKLTPDANGNWSEEIIYTFDGTNGYAWGPLFIDSMGNLYGTTKGDGTTTFGSVFEITP